jgi:ribosomal protein S18 acetylase RimI-like enzyme
VTDVAVRPATPQDADAIALVHLAARAHALPGLREAHPVHDVRRWVRERLLPGNVVDVVTEDGLVVAYVATDPGGGELEHLYVDPPAQGRGHGTALLSHVLARAAGPVELWTFQRNVAALAFYARHGFTEVRRTDGAGNEEHEPDVRLRHPGP